MSDHWILEARNLNKSYGSRKIIRELDLQVAPGDIYGFLGPNGAGKTTTIRMLLGLIRHNSGSIRIRGYDIRRQFKKAIEKVGAVVEIPRFYESYSAYDNLKMTANLYADIPRTRIHEVLEITGLQSRSRDRVKTYSLGMKQRLGIARALIQNPELVILDEPTNGLDPQGMKEIRELILLLAKQRNITFFISSHLLGEIEQTCNKVGIINKGSKIAEGYVNQLLQKEFETVELHLNDAPRAMTLLNRIPCVKSLELQENVLASTIERGMSGELSRILVENGFSLKYLIPKKQSLEDYYIKMTEGGDHIV